MSTVLCEEKVVPGAAGEAGLNVPVPVTVLFDTGELTFQPATAADYTITSQSISLKGSGGTPRQFLLTFTLSDAMIVAGYRFANPALKFFQAQTKNAGFRFPPEASETEARASLFNTMDDKDSKATDEFSILILKPTGQLLVHDPTIVWDPPGG